MEFASSRASRRGSIVPFLILALVVGAAAYFGWREYDRRAKARQAREDAYARLVDEQAARDRAAAEEARRRAAARTAPLVAETASAETNAVPVVRSPLEIWTVRAAARKAAQAQVAVARAAFAGKPLNGFAGIRFDEPVKDGSAVAWGTVLGDAAGATVATRGAAFAVYGPTLKKPFLSLGTQPLVWVTPQTHRPYRIEFSRALRPRAETALPRDAETTNLVAFLATRFKTKPVVTLPPAAEAPGCEYVFPLGVATITVAEREGRLVFAVERDDVRATALAESEAQRAAARAVTEADGRALLSKRYPHRPIDRGAYRGVKLQDATPRSFCGVVFAAPPPEGVTAVVPQKGPKGFFLDYEWAKCAPFRGFARGRADLDSRRGGVYALTLFSAGGTGGLDDADYVAAVRAALTDTFKVEPAVVPPTGTAAHPTLRYVVGDLEITFAPDPRGGFTLRAENAVLAALAEPFNASAAGE